jgi:hypothetical protein
LGVVYRDEEGHDFRAGSEGRLLLGEQRRRACAGEGQGDQEALETSAKTHDPSLPDLTT